LQLTALNPRRKSLIRANLIVFVNFGLALLISHAPHLQPTLWLILPLLGSLVGTADTLRCMQRRWNFYHGGVILCIYTDLMVITLILFFLLYPYFIPFSTTH
jgi:hypothetical protein